MKKEKGEKTTKSKAKDKGALYTRWQFWLAATILVLVIIHCLFSISAPTKFFEAKWSAGDLLTFLGTIVLGYVAVMQTHKANQTAERATQISERLMQKELSDDLPKIDIRPLSKSALANCSVEKCLKATVDNCLCKISNKMEIEDTDGDVLFFGIKNVCNHDILDVSLVEVKVKCPNKNRMTHPCGYSVYDGSLSAGESTALILAIPSKYYEQIAEYNLSVPEEEHAGLFIMLRFHLVNYDGSTYVQVIKFDAINAEQSKFLPPVFVNKKIEKPFLLH